MIWRSLKTVCGTKIQSCAMTRSSNTILEELAREQARLAELERARDETRAKIESLRLEFASASATTTPPPPPALTGKAPNTPAEKVKLFRSLFQGRTDVFPTRFVSKKTGKPGYAPACSNKWEPGLCLLKTGGKCSDCVNQAFVAVDDQIVTGHLQGRHVVGTYRLPSSGLHNWRFSSTSTRSKSAVSGVANESPTAASTSR